MMMQASEGLRRALIIEDDEDSRYVYGLILEDSGFEVITARTGTEGLRLAREGNPSVILMDVSVPEMDGWTVTRMLKDDPATSAIPVIIVTAHAFPEDWEKAEHVRCDRFLTKPCEPPDVLEAVLGLGRRLDPPQDRPATHASSPATVVGAREQARARASRTQPTNNAVITPVEIQVSEAGRGPAFSDGRLPDRLEGRDARPPAESEAPAEEALPPLEGPDTGKYVYCIVEAREELELGPLGIGEGENRVYTVHYGDLAAVVSDTPVRLYDPTPENILAHELVNDAAMKDRSVLPMSFGTIFRTEADVAELLRSTGTAFSDVLSKIRGKVELGLKVVWDREKIVARLEEEDPGIRGLKAEIMNATAGSTFLARVQLGRLVEAALEQRSNELITRVYEALMPLSVATRSNKLIGDNMILNAAFLVERALQIEFDRVVQELSSRYQDVVRYKYTGPWPPYNFVNIKLKLERAE